MAVFGVEDAADLIGDFLLEILGGDVARFDGFIRTGTDVLGAFHEHGGVHEKFCGFRELFAEAVLKKALDEIMVGGSGGLGIGDWGLPLHASVIRVNLRLRKRAIRR